MQRSRYALACALVWSLLLCACAGHPVKTGGGTAAAPAPATTTAPAAASAAGTGTDSGTPIPDLNPNDASPVVEWSDLTLTPAEPHYDDLWQYLGQHFTLPAEAGDGRVQGELDWFAAHGEYLNRVEIGRAHV